MENEKLLSDYIGQTLILVQPKFFSRDYLLKEDEKMVASIHHPKWYGSNFIIEWGERKLEVYRPSIWKSIIEIKECGRQLPFASYTRTGWKSEGAFNLPMGQKLKLVFRPFKGAYEIQNIGGECLVLIKDKFSFKDKTEFYVQKPSELINKYPWAILVAWHISSERKHHSAIAAG
jgi:hypothetical protein